MNVRPLRGTTDSSLPAKTPPVAGNDASLSFLAGERLAYARNLVQDWQAQLQHLGGLKSKSCKKHRDNLFRLLNEVRLAPWELRKEHVTRFLESRVDQETGETLAPATVGSYFSAWRSFQGYMLEPERVNEIQRQFHVRPTRFLTEENGIAVKRHKVNWVPAGWALTPAQIDAIDETFRAEILSAHRAHSKALLPLMRDRVMFHVAIHFALRVSELVTAKLSDFRPSHDPELSHFGALGVLTVTGKNDVTASVPMREPAVHALLDWYLKSCRQKILLRRQGKGDDGTCRYGGQDYRVADLLFPSERGGVVCPNALRKRLTDISMKSGVIDRKLTPHTLRHTGCTLMVPIYSPDVAQRYMRHKHLHTTLYYYHPTPLDAANEANTPLMLFCDDENDTGDEGTTP